MTHFAHSSENGPWEPLDRHLMAVAERAEALAGPFGAASLGRAAGLLHDAGKFRETFQRYLRREVSSAEHSVLGAILAAERFYPTQIGRLLAYVVAGHHAGLPDGGSADDSCLDARIHNGRA
ncbi:MAG: CRISPR-associated endonuclease Cas3'', partial [Actinomycetota bacterium]